jgi:hypothetical protein
MFGVLSFLLLNVSVYAEEYYISDCSVLDQEGATYYLTQDIIDKSEDCINIQANNITFDCQGHIVDGVDNNKGINIISYSNITLKNCIISDWWWGIYIDGGSNFILSNIISDSNRNGIYIHWGYNHTLSNMILFFNFYAIQINGGSNFILSNITLDSNLAGIIFSVGGNHTLSNINISNSDDVGIWMYNSRFNIIYNSLFNNTNNLRLDGTYPNFWNTTRQEGTRIYSLGIEIGGNYWTNPSGTGYSDTCEDADKDGFCDEPYVLGENNIDYLALSDEYSPPLPTPPQKGIPMFNAMFGLVMAGGSLLFVFRALLTEGSGEDKIKILVAGAIIFALAVAVIASMLI